MKGVFLEALFDLVVDFFREGDTRTWVRGLGITLLTLGLAAAYWAYWWLAVALVVAGVVILALTVRRPGPVHG